ncbi:MAG: type IIL restriction-modification enzyme MmeI [Desulfovibrio piger]|uniref:type IIL restriction-modification enzyme MmeI n=1 Tax=Desulfovibrio piger TaxID=901 RepID=UPI00399A8EBE
MAVLNQAKIIKSLEKIIKISQEDFIWEFLKAYGTPLATIKRLRLGDTQRNVARISGDLGVNQKLYFRPAKVGTSLFDAIQEIKKLAVLETNKIRFILVTDFQTVMAYDRKVDDSTEFPFEEFPVNYEFFLPMTGLYEKAIAYAEHPADTKACEKMGRLYDSIRTINHYEKDELHTLNVFLTRLLFCFSRKIPAYSPSSIR